MPKYDCTKNDDPEIEAKERNGKLLIDCEGTTLPSYCLWDAQSVGSSHTWPSWWTQIDNVQNWWSEDEEAQRRVEVQQEEAQREEAQREEAQRRSEDEDDDEDDDIYNYQLDEAEEEALARNSKLVRDSAPSTLPSYCFWTADSLGPKDTWETWWN
jgi:hypothetical protein